MGNGSSSDYLVVSPRAGPGKLSMRKTSTIAITMLCSLVLLGGTHAVTLSGIDEDFIQPGRHIKSIPPPNNGVSSTTASSQCSIGFILQDGNNGPYYATTAGHCLAVGKPAQSNMWWSATPLAEVTWGQAVYGRVERTTVILPELGALEVTIDHVLIQISPDYQENVNKSLPIFGGPTGVADASEVLLGTPVGHYGLPAIIGTPSGLPRAGAFGGHDGAIEWSCHCAAVKGDSGSPFIELVDGKALGLLSGYNLHPTPESAGHAYGMDIAFVLDDIRAAGWPNMRLATAPLTVYGSQFG